VPGSHHDDISDAPSLKSRSNQPSGVTIDAARARRLRGRPPRASRLSGALPLRTRSQGVRADATRAV